MSILKGFGEITGLIDNNHLVTATVGELSPDSKTFVRDYSTHTHQDWPGVALHSMQSLNDDLEPTSPTLNQYQALLELINWTYAKARSAELGPSKNSFVQLFEATFNGRFTLLSSGEHVTYRSYWFPTSFSVCPAGREGTDNWTVWLADAAFNNEFDVSDIIVVPPIENIDQFFNDYNTVLGLVNGTSRSSIMDRITVVRGGSPYTILRMDPFEWVSPNDVNQTINTYWNIIIYGRAGDNIDRVKEAIIQYVLANSSRNIEAWAARFPDIFRSTELVVTPAFYAHAIPEQNFERGVYTAIASVKDMTEILKATARGVGYTTSYVANGCTIIPSQYRSLMLSMVTGPENRNNYKTFRQIYPDYLNCATTAIDFVRMREKTREFVLTLNEMLALAEAMTPATVVPPGYNRVEREGIWYLTRTVNDLLVLVTSKYSVQQALTTLNIPSDN